MRESPKLLGDEGLNKAGNVLSFKMEHQEYESPKELQHVIKCFWCTKIDFGSQPSGFEVIPDGYAEIIFHFGSGCSIYLNGTLQPLPSPFITGLLNQPVTFYSENILVIIGIRCFPWTVFDLLGIPSGKEGVRLFEHPVAGLQSALKDWVDAGKIDDAVARIAQYFLNGMTAAALDNTLFKAGAAISDANGSIQVSEVAAAAHATVRTLERKFKQSTGHSVKDVAALMRFERVRNQLWLNPDIGLAGLAYEMGYTDQSHLTREFKRYAGTTPAAFARKAKKGKQLISNNFVAFIQA